MLKVWERTWRLLIWSFASLCGSVLSFGLSTSCFSKTGAITFGSVFCVPTTRSTRWAAAPVILGRVSCCPPMSWVLSRELIQSSQRNDRKSHTKPFHDELPVDSKVTDCMRVFSNATLACRRCYGPVGMSFEGQRQVARLLPFVFAETMLSLTDNNCRYTMRNFNKPTSMISGKILYWKWDNFGPSLWYRLERHDYQSDKDALEFASFRTHALVNAGTGDRLRAALQSAVDSFQNRA